MKKLIIAAVLLGLAALSAAEAVPEYVTLTIRDGRVSGMNFESARTPLVRTALHGDVLDVDIRAEFPPGKGGCKFDFAIPPGAKKIKLFGCVFDLPPAGYTAFSTPFCWRRSASRGGVSRGTRPNARCCSSRTPRTGGRSRRNSGTSATPAKRVGRMNGTFPASSPTTGGYTKSWMTTPADASVPASVSGIRTSCAIWTARCSSARA